MLARCGHSTVRPAMLVPNRNADACGIHKATFNQTEFRDSLSLSTAAHQRREIRVSNTHSVGCLAD